MVVAPYELDTPNRDKISILAEAQNWRCAYCGIRCDGGHNEHNAASRDHIIPKSAKIGGDLYAKFTWENEIMACRLCNSHRGAMWARHYFQIVSWKGRDKAARWSRRRARRRSMARKTAKIS